MKYIAITCFFVGVIIGLIWNNPSHAQGVLHGSHTVTIDQDLGGNTYLAYDELISFTPNKSDDFVLDLGAQMKNSDLQVKPSIDLSWTRLDAFPHWYKNVDMTLGNRLFLNGKDRIYAIFSYGW